ncbi:MAG: class I SAM-dependent methyltransferase [Propionibacteriaceae bacterium]|jgi:SAM-dependent methyltransferase|nr:class I SAM-dependent methyltransferase [Propionibacteriaceae bacterium]
MANTVTLSDAQVERLREALAAADYRIDATLAAIGEAGQADLARNHTVAAERALAGRDDPLATLIRLFILQLPQPAAAVQRTLPARDLLAAGLLTPAASPTGGPALAAAVDLRPYGGDDGVNGWLVSDHQATLNTARGRPRPDHVLGCSPASVTLAQLTPRTPVGSALDLGTGCGIQALHLARHCARLTATDLNPRALELARLSLALSGVTADLRPGSLYEPVAGESFDLIVTNPPFVIAPPRADADRLVYREGAEAADGLMRRVVAESGRHLADGGHLVVLGNWAHVRGEPWEERVAGWLPPGADAIAVQREVLDAPEYAEVWLADAGLQGTPDYRAELDRWLAYFDALGLERVGLGWLVLRQSRRADPSVTALDWPYPVTQPVAADLIATLDAVDAARLPDAALAAARWRLAADAYQETTSEPGAADPLNVRLRRRVGLQRWTDVDAALGGVLGACDGELPLGALVAAVASLTGDDPAALAARLLPQLRRLVAESWLVRVV